MNETNGTPQASLTDEERAAGMVDAFRPFSAEEWAKRLAPRVSREFRVYVADLDLDQLIEEEREKEGDIADALREQENWIQRERIARAELDAVREAIADFHDREIEKGS